MQLHIYHFLTESILLHSFPFTIPFIYVASCDLPSFYFLTPFGPYSNLGGYCLFVLILVDYDVALHLSDCPRSPR